MSGAGVRLAAGPSLAAALTAREPLLLPGGRLIVEVAVPERLPPAPAAGARLTFDGAVPLAGADRRLRSWATDAAEARFLVEVEAVGAWGVAADGRRVVHLAAHPGADPEAELEAALGAPLTLALAVAGNFVLHASAVRAPSGAAALFLGDSGAGKSTLAAFLDAAGWRRLADDMTPVAAASPEGGGVEVRPRFPQLKLPGGALAGVAERLPWGGACVLATGDEVTLDRLPPRQAAEALLRHTVAARSFDRPLLAAHLAAVARWVEAGVWRLAYPRRREALPVVAVAVAAALRGG